MAPVLALVGLLGVARAAPVTVRADWTRETLTVRVVAPAGHHLSEEAPASVQAGALRWEGHGDGLVAGVALPRPGDAVSGRLEAAVCSDADGTCAPFSLAFAGPLPGRRARDQVLPSLDRAAVARQAAPHHGPDLDAALVQAAADGKPILVDFGAVWCPPCNLLAAQVLHDAGDAELLADFVVVEVDVDRVESWPVKDRFDVGGYPTVVVLRPDGSEQDRLVGYPGEPAFKAWLARARSQAGPALGALPAPDDLDPSAAAELARRLAEVQREEEARPYLARAAALDAAGVPVPALQVARVLVEGDTQAARWLVEHAAFEGEWLWAALDLAPGDPALAAALWAAATRALPEAEPVLASDLLYVLGRLAPEGEGAVLFGAAAATLGAVLTGDPALDRGHWTSLADLRQLAGDPAGARALLEEAAAAYPDEMTFHYALAGLLLEQGDPAGALVSIRAAAAVAYGDNALRVARREAETLAALGHPDAAVDLIDRTLAAAPLPAEGTRVRTFRYRRALEELRGELAGEGKD